MKPSERGQVLVEFMLFVMVFTTLWAVLMNHRDENSVHSRIKESVEKTQLTIRLNFPTVNLHTYGQ